MFSRSEGDTRQSDKTSRGKKSIIKLHSTRRWVPPGPQVSSSLMTERGHIALP